MITSHDLSLFLDTALSAAPELADAWYSLPSPDWIAGEFAAGLRSTLNQLGFIWTPEKSDCDDFARFAAAYAALLHSRMGNTTGLAFGEFWFLRDSGQGHAINCFVAREHDNSLKLYFFEPQTQQVFTLSQTEIQSCDFCRF